MRDHRKLKIFTIVDALILEVYKITNYFPKEEVFGLTSQMRRAAVSAASNIVEGCSRSSQNDFVRFLEISHGSLRELNYQLSLSNRLGYISDEEFNKIESMCNEACKVMAGLINSIRKDKEE